MGTRRLIVCNIPIDWDHPHAYGDKVELQNKQIDYLGSSPRVWGQVSDIIVSLRTSRIIPTRMGTSTAATVDSMRNCDHPHAYGDKQFLQKSTSSAPGSSPRVWGQEKIYTLSTICCGIIPTRMGTRLFR